MFINLSIFNFMEHFGGEVSIVTVAYVPLTIISGHVSSKDMHIYMKDAHSAESNEKSCFIFFELWLILLSFFLYDSSFWDTYGRFWCMPPTMMYEKSPIHKIDHISKIKNCKNQNIDFSFISTHCTNAHLSCKVGHFTWLYNLN